MNVRGTFSCKIPYYFSDKVLIPKIETSLASQFVHPVHEHSFHNGDANSRSLGVYCAH